MYIEQVHNYQNQTQLVLFKGSTLPNETEMVCLESLFKCIYMFTWKVNARIDHMMKDSTEQSQSKQAKKDPDERLHRTKSMGEEM